MSKDLKEKIQYISAGVMLCFGIALTIAGFVTPPEGEVDGSVLAIFGQCLLFSGSVFGISLHYSTELKNFKNEVRNEIKDK